jgi:hypothetical protein
MPRRGPGGWSVELRRNADCSDLAFSPSRQPQNGQKRRSSTACARGPSTDDGPPSPRQRQLCRYGDSVVDPRPRRNRRHLSGPGSLARGGRLRW